MHYLIGFYKNLNGVLVKNKFEKLMDHIRHTINLTI